VFLDRDRIGIWGWSYGGYLALMAMTHSPRFAAGVAVAPVTDWRNYDAIYTERYMGLPRENAEGYRRSSPQQHAADLRGKLLIVHGTSDDNVHMQNTVQMADALIRAGKQFDLMLYPGKTHSITGAEARVHLFQRVQQHFERELLGAK
ncbi:MAG: alpha/beta hydrolase family protein, partial [Terriglobales bacterium]